MSVLDASAILAFLHGEEGADAVEEALDAGAVVGAANWSEIAQKIVASDRDWDFVRGFLLGFGLTVEPVRAADAERAAERWTSARHLSLGDRLCLALADRLEAEVLTADRAWGSDAPVRQIH